MKRGWLNKPLNDLVTVINGYSFKSGDFSERNATKCIKITNVGVKEFVSDSSSKLPTDFEKKYSRFQAPKGSIVIALTRTIISSGLKVALVPQDFDGALLNQRVAALKNKSGNIENQYLFYFLCTCGVTDYVMKKANTLMQPNLSINDLKNLIVPLPPRAEQKSIVTILNEAFAGIDSVIANTKKNLANARELFDSYLSVIFYQEKKQWDKHRLGSIVYRLTNGYVGPTRNIYIDDGIPYLLARQVKNNSLAFDGKTYVSEKFNQKNKKSILKSGDVLLVQSGHIGHSAVVPEEHAGHNCHAMIVITPTELLLGEYLSLFFNSSEMKSHFKEIRSGSTVPHLTCKAVKEIEIPVPDLQEQKVIIRDYKDYAAEILRLESIYTQKLKSLSELKQSLLQKAFSGELTANEMIAVSKPNKMETTTPQFTANIIALAYHRHAIQKRDKTFGHVKAQKIMHLTESIAGIDLGRTPIKDAAGPNDFQHMLRGENWARSKKFFEFTKKKTGNGYDFKKLKSFDAMLVGARAMTGRYSKGLEEIINLIIPMDSSETEIFATVHAAWNNLVLDGVQITNEAIIREARENWHADKQKIPVPKFRKAIQLIRDKGLVPEGRGKRVGVQQDDLFTE